MSRATRAAQTGQPRQRKATAAMPSQTADSLKRPGHASFQLEAYSVRIIASIVFDKCTLLGYITTIRQARLLAPPSSLSTDPSLSHVRAHMNTCAVGNLARDCTYSEVFAISRKSASR